MTHEVVTISNIKTSDPRSKYREFVLDDGRSFTGKGGYFYYLAYNVIGDVEFPVKVRLDQHGLECFHVEAIWHKNVWVKLHSRGY